MTINEEIIKQTQFIARCEKNLALEKIKKRRADTRRKIEFGGLVIKSAMDAYNKSVILGALTHALELMQQESHYQSLFESIGDNMFLET